MATHPFVSRRWFLRVTLAAACSALLLTLLCAPAALAGGVWWHLQTTAAPSNLPPGGEGQIVLSASDLGYENVGASTAHPVRISDRLPAGLEVITGPELRGYEATGEGLERDRGRSAATEFKCQAETPEEHTTVSCQAPAPIPAYEGLEVIIPVRISASIPSGTELENEGRIEGGGEGAQPSATRTQTVTVANDPTRFGVDAYELQPQSEEGTPDTQAGSHPFQLTTGFTLNQTLQPDGNPPREQQAAPALPRNLHFTLPPGLVGNVTAIPQCAGGQFTTIASKDINLCPESTAIGVARVTINEPVNFHGVLTETVPVFNLEPAYGEPARFGFEIQKVTVILTTALRTGQNYAVEVSIANAPQTVALLASEVTLWGVPNDARHNDSRGWECLGGGYWVAGLEPAKPCQTPTETEAPFLTLPTSCAGPPTSTVQGVSWTGEPLGGDAQSYSFPASLTGCQALELTPALSVTPETTAASTPSGLTVKITVPQDSTLSVKGLAEADIRDTTVALPVGVQASPGAAYGLTTCSSEAIGLTGSFETAPGEANPLLNEQFSGALADCPEEAKLGTVAIKTPLLASELHGYVYLASQDTNPFASPLVLYLVANDPQAGVHVKLAGEVYIDPNTGQLTSTFDQTPQVPFSELTLNLFGGPRAPQTTPPQCGSYNTSASFEPWAASENTPRPAQTTAAFQIENGPEAAPCPPTPPAFTPGFQAGASDTQAGAYTSFTLELARPDQDQALTGVTLTLPPGIAATLATVPLCQEAQANAGACPAASEIGQATALAGLGPEPYIQAGGHVYLTGPYQGAPFGLEILTPAQAGPFNLGNVIVRSKIEVNPHTAAVTIISDPLPTQLKGIPLQLKRVLVTVDRPSFEFNPTSCAPMKIEGTLTGAAGATSNVSSPFQVSGCQTLPFKPTVTASTQGKTSKADGASLKLTFKSKPGEAHVATTILTIPATLPARLTTIQKACVASVFEANPAACPEGSDIGTAVVHTPVLKNPVSGPIYLVSRGNAAWPDAELVLQGEGITVILDGQTAIKKGVTTSSFLSVPDAPFESVEAKLPEGPHSALTANLPFKDHYSLCDQHLTIPTALTGQNGTAVNQNVKVSIQDCHAVKASKAKHLTRKQKLARALKACRPAHRHSGAERDACERRARNRYSPKSKSSKSGAHKT